MKKEFPGHFSGKPDEIEKMWNECVFILDANVLLNLYRYSELTRLKLLEVLQLLVDRLWVPHQVVLEYLNNRLGVISGQSKSYDDTVKKIEILRKALEDHNQHPFIKSETLKVGLDVFARIVDELNSNKLTHEERITSDELKDRLEVLLDGRVGKSYSHADLEKIIVDGKVRYEQKKPPGFCDAKKGGDSKVFAEACRPYGDYIVWLQIIDYAKEANKPVIFITGDTKDDWWDSFQGRTLGPHPQLIEEFVSSVGQDFYMYPPDRFLEKASVYLKQDTNDQAVAEIREILEDDSQAAFAASQAAIEAMLERDAAQWTDTNIEFYKENPSFGSVENAVVKERKIAFKTRFLAMMKSELEVNAARQYNLMSAGYGADTDFRKREIEKANKLEMIIAVLESELESFKA